MAVTTPQQVDVFASDSDVNVPSTDQFSQLGAMMTDRFQPFEQNVQKYQQRLAPYMYQAPRMNIFDLASELGAGLLSTPNTGGASAFTGLGVGFNRVSDRLRHQEEQNAKARQQIGFQAAQLAMQDEQKAVEFLNAYDLKRIDAANKKVDYITFEFDETDADGNVSRVTRTFPNIASSREEIDDIRINKNGTEVSAAQTQINMPDPNTGYGDRKAIDAIDEQSQSYREKADASASTIEQVKAAYLLAQQAIAEGAKNGLTPEEVFGPFSTATLRMRETVINLGFGNLLDSEGTVAPLKALNQLSMNFVMGIVSQTKGAISEREMELFINASPTVGSTYEGFMKQLQMLEKLASRDKEFYRDYLTKMDELDQQEIRGKRQQIALEKFTLDWQENNPFLTPEEETLLQNAIDNPNVDKEFVPKDYKKLIEDRKQQMARIKAVTPTVTTQEEFNALKSGDEYYGTDGRLYRKT